MCYIKMDTFTDIKSGLDFCLRSNNECYNAMVKNGIFEYELIKWSEKFLTPESVFIDIGSHIGTYSIILSKKCKHVHAFEPQKLIYSCLRVGSKLNNTNNITTHDVALGETNSSGKMYSVSKDGGGSSLNPEVLQTQIISTENVEISTLDSFNITGVDFMKIDVEGFELSVLKGAKNTLFNNRYPPFIFEVWQEDWFKDQKDKLLNYICDLGYEVTTIEHASNMYLAHNHPRRKAYDAFKSLVKITPDSCVDGYNSKLEAECGKILSDIEIGKNLSFYYLKLALIYCELGKVTECQLICDKLLLCYDKVFGIDIVKQLHLASITPLDLQDVFHIKYEVSEHHKPSSFSIIKHEGGYKIAARTVNYELTKNGYYIYNGTKIQTSENKLLFLDNKLNVRRQVEIVDRSPTPKLSNKILGMEDIRLFGDCWFLCTYPQVNKDSVPQICLGKYLDDGCVEKIIPLKVENNNGPEKNWLPFVNNDGSYFIYSFDPFKLYKLDLETGKTTLEKCVKLNNIDMSSFRGSSSPIRYNNGWLFTIHQVYYGDYIKYLHRFAWMDEKFSTIKFSKLFDFEHLRVEYNMGLYVENNKVFVGYSVFDSTSQMGSLSCDMLDTLLTYSQSLESI